METVNQIPKWFWISLIAIVLITIIAIKICNNKKVQNANEVLSQLDTTVNKDVLDNMSNLQNMMM